MKPSIATVVFAAAATIPFISTTALADLVPPEEAKADDKKADDAKADDAKADDAKADDKKAEPDKPTEDAKHEIKSDDKKDDKKDAKKDDKKADKKDAKKAEDKKGCSVSASNPAWPTTGLAFGIAILAGLRLRRRD